MKKILCAFIALIMVLSLTACSKSSKVSNEKAVSDKKNRYISITIKLDVTINKIAVFVGKGIEIKDLAIENPDDKSISLKVPKEYKKYKEFTVVCKDRYGMNYEKKQTVKNKGTTEIVITEDCYKESSGDTWKSINKWFNGD